MPDKRVLADRSPVHLPTGEVVAAIGWHRWWIQRFEVFDPIGAVVASCLSSGFFRRRYLVRTPESRPVLELTPVGFTQTRLQATVGTGTPITVTRARRWSDRYYEFHGAAGIVGRVTPSTHGFTFHPDSYVVEMLQPAMSALEVISLAHTVRLVAQSQRAAASS